MQAGFARFANRKHMSTNVANVKKRREERRANPFPGVS